MKARNSRPARLVLVSCLCILAAMIGFSISASAQSDSNPKYDIFVGYQWLHPGATVPAPFGDPNNPTPFKVPDMSPGFGAAFTYNFDPHWGAEFDLGHNWGNSNYETTVSAGPRFMWRSEGSNLFVHALFSYNRLSVNGLGDPRNGIGAILGGGWDLPFNKVFSWRVFEADYVFARQNFADFAAPQFPVAATVARGRPASHWRGIQLGRRAARSANGRLLCATHRSHGGRAGNGDSECEQLQSQAHRYLRLEWQRRAGHGQRYDRDHRHEHMAPGNYAVSAHVTDPRAKTNNEAS